MVAAPNLAAAQAKFLERRQSTLEQASRLLDSHGLDASLRFMEGAVAEDPQWRQGWQRLAELRRAAGRPAEAEIAQHWADSLAPAPVRATRVEQPPEWQPGDPWTASQTTAIWVAGPVSGYVGTILGLALGVALAEPCPPESHCIIPAEAAAGALLGTVLFPMIAVAVVGQLAEAEGSPGVMILGALLGGLVALGATMLSGGTAVVAAPGLVGLGASLGWATGAPERRSYPGGLTAGRRAVGWTVLRF